MKRKRVTSKMEDISSDVLNCSEFIPGRLYFVTWKKLGLLKSTTKVHYFYVETLQCYYNFYDDFGPLNLAILYHFCEKLDRKLANPDLRNKKIVHYSDDGPESRVNAAFLIGAYAIIRLNMTPDQVYEILTKNSKRKYVEYRDASLGDPYTISLLDCLRAVKKAFQFGFFDFVNFDYLEYEHYERVDNGDLNWVVPEKFIAFCGPITYGMHPPETYFSYFRRHNVTTIIRLNTKDYDANSFIQAGFDHRDLFFIDGGIPTEQILDKFISICENAKGVIAVHCKAGLGRTGTLIACYIMKHYKFSAEEAIAWIRICRPGSIIAHQQTWLIQKQKELWASGDTYRQRNKLSGPTIHKNGIYTHSVKNNNNNNKLLKSNDNVTGIAEKVDLMGINDERDLEKRDSPMSQGDRLNAIKVQRAKVKQQLVPSLTERKSFRTKTTPTTLRRGVNGNTKTPTSSTRVLTKRNEMNETQTPRRCSPRKTSSLINKLPEARPKKKENLSWLIKTVKDDKVETVKRNKRTLVSEKDKASPNVKVLRRSHGQSSKDLKKEGKLHLPSVKLNKSV